MTPFELEGGGIVGVIQGWVPRKVEATGAQQQQQQQQIVGVHSLPHETLPFVVQRHTAVAGSSGGGGAQPSHPPSIYI